MQWFSPIAEGGTSCGEAPLKLTVVVVYEDLRTGLRARQLLNRTMEGLSAPVDVEVSLWRSDLLLESTLRQQATREAAESDILFISTHGKDEQAVTLSRWSEEWFGSRRGEPSALALVLDVDPNGSAGATQQVEALAAAARQAGVDVFLYVENAQTDSESTLEDIQHRAETRMVMTQVPPSQAQRHPSRYWGINE